MTGVSNQAWGLIPLPLDLTPFLAPGCKLLASIDVLQGVPTSPAGTASVKLLVPPDRNLIGARLYHQFLVFDAATKLGLVFSNGGESTIGG
ncbi:MAG: hypothetical protein ACE5F1_04185 [Planctomycetota bacterium]